MFIATIHAPPAPFGGAGTKPVFLIHALPAPPNGAGGLGSASYKHVTPGGVADVLPH